MGAARIRKLNGTYPTPQQIAAMEEERRRRNTKVWYPTAADLPLAHIPEDARSRLRERLEPWLVKLTHMGGKTQRVGVKGGQCYRVAQALVLTAKDPNVRYVEGLWAHGAGHGWAIVDGYRVDLIGEFFHWRDGSNERFYEPHQEFSADELRAALAENGYNDATILHYEREGNPATFSIVHQRWLDDVCDEVQHTCHDFDGPANNCECEDRSVMCKQWEDCECEMLHIMASAFARLKQRIAEEEEADCGGTPQQRVIDGLWFNGEPYKPPKAKVAA